MNNTRRKELEAIKNRIEEALAELDWTCTGHTRADWQGEAAADWLNKHGFAAEVQCNGDVRISLAKGGAK